MAGYAGAVDAVHETVATAIGLDPDALQAIHDCAEAAAGAAEAMADARRQFTAHYAEVRQFAASGGVLPYDGRWMTSDDSTSAPALADPGSPAGEQARRSPRRAVDSRPGGDRQRPRHARRPGNPQTRAEDPGLAEAACTEVALQSYFVYTSGRRVP